MSIYYPSMCSSEFLEDMESYEEDNSIISRIPQIFYGDNVSITKLYLAFFGSIPDTLSAHNIDSEKSLEWVCSYYRQVILNTIVKQSVGENVKLRSTHRAIFILKDEIIAELTGESWCIYYQNNQAVLALGMIQGLFQWRLLPKKRPFEINLLVKQQGVISLTAVPVSETKLDLTLFYNDDFVSLDELLRKELSKEKTKGLILLHGAPGTGKTTYLRHLIGNLRKPVLYLSPGMADCLMDPGFIETLIDNPNSILVIEEAESILKSRQGGSNPSVSNLLNIADGLLSDCLNIQIICTFNHPIIDIDSALLRKGRLIARYDFKPLSIAKAQKLSDHFGHNVSVTSPMTVADIAKMGSGDFSISKPTIGFRPPPISDLPF